MKSLDEIAELLHGQAKKPPIDKWHPDLSGDIDIEIRSDGRWFHEGTEIQRHELVKLFASILRRESDSCYYLVTPVEKWRIRVADHPLRIVDAELADDCIVLKTNTDDWLELGAEHALVVDENVQTGEPDPYVGLAHGLSAKLERAVFYFLVNQAEEDDGQLWLRSKGQRYSLGNLEGNSMQEGNC